jgi:hypothetical protein
MVVGLAGGPATTTQVTADVVIDHSAPGWIAGSRTRPCCWTGSERLALDRSGSRGLVPSTLGQHDHVLAP